MQEYPIFPAPLKIRFKGYFDFEGVYRLIQKWFINRQFRYHEKRYKDKLDTPRGNEIELDVWGEKEVTEYYKYYVEVNYHLWESKDVPVLEGGKKVMRCRGRMDLKLHGKIITDWQKRYDSSNFVQKSMELFLNKFVLKNEREMKHIDYLDKELHKLEAQIKKFLKMETDAVSV